MSHKFQIQVLPEEAFDDDQLRRLIQSRSEVTDGGFKYRILKRSIDARKSPVKYNLQIEVFESAEAIPDREYDITYQDVKNSRPIHIIGAGPAGLFAGLQALEMGLKPVILERGKQIRDRRRDLAKLTKEHIVDPDSNYCFGEGGAGTFSDGKLYTRSKKRGDVQRVLEILVHHGAPEDILVDAQPHIGTNKLPGIIESMRETIIGHGGEIHFGCRVDDIIENGGKVSAVETSTEGKIPVEHLIVATGHSARDIFRMIHSKGWQIEAKPFALGVRVEHPQSLIDKIQYNCDSRGEYLPPASYRLVHQVKGKGVYSFCMCPGGIIAPCATSPGEVVTNGWSPSKRDNPWANSGIVVEIDPMKLPGSDPLRALEFQSSIEQKACEIGGGDQTAPAQRLMDFLNGKVSGSLPSSSYLPGTASADMAEVLPKFVIDTLRGGFKAFGNKMRGYLSNDAVVHAVESRTSSPVRIPRDKETLSHPQVSGLYPCGEGAGYAGGIVSAAMDGIRIVRAIKEFHGSGS